METFAKKDQNITIKDIAKLAQVSYSTVSRCLNNSSLVSDKTKAKVKKIADQLGFEFNASARGLVTKKSGTIGMILPDNFSHFNVYIHQIRLMNQMQTILEKEDYDLMVTFWKNHFTGRDNIKKMISRKKVDGIILLIQRIDVDLIHYLNENQIPYLFSHYPAEIENENVKAIYPDNFLGGHIVGEHLNELGYSRFICVNCNATEKTSKEFNLRVNGFCQAIESKQKNSAIKLMDCEKSFQSGYELVKNNLVEFKKADAVFAVTDLMAFGIMKGLNEFKIKIPRDIALVGYDNIELCNFFTPTLTSVHQVQEEIASITCRELINLIEAKETKNIQKKILISPFLVKRESCGYELRRSKI